MFGLVGAGKWGENSQPKVDDLWAIPLHLEHGELWLGE